MEERKPSPSRAGDMLPGALGLGYPRPRDRWDEMVGDEGLRPHWQSFIRTLTGLPEGEMQARWDRGLRMIRENGVTYNVYGDPRGLDRPWQLDPVPMIIDAAEWRRIEAAVAQRAHLLDLVLGDLYGQQSLLADGILPPAMAFAHPSYLRPLRHVAPPGGRHLHFYAAELARSPDGHWWVMADRTEAPSGAGYALENRLIISRSMGDILRHQPVEPLTPFFHKLQETLTAVSPRSREAPRTVLLTPGPYNETYFEHAYLARNLGFTLVESEDLTMRDGRIFLKTLDGLQPVDVILRRTDGSYCDPLELRGDSALGVAGLVRSVRNGHVAVVNALGSGVLEGGALAAFLPVLCRHLLDEDLRMPSLATWWCGGDKERSYVLEHLDRLVVKPALPGQRNRAPVFGARLGDTERAALAEAIRRHPQDYLAQESISLSHAPVWCDGRLEPRAMMLRVYAVAHDGGYAVMPGGLARVAAERGGHIVSMQQGGGSKDTWVLAEERQTPAITLRPVSAPVKLVRGSRDLPSRVADNLFWLGRYLERAEDTIRVLRAAFTRASGQAGFGAAEELAVVLAMATPQFSLKKGGSLEARCLELARLNLDPQHANGLRAMAERVHRTAALVRDRLSLDTWRAINRLQRDLAQARPGPRLSIEDALLACDSAILTCEALAGLGLENMTRGLSWRFMDIGRRLERGLHVVDLLSGICLQEEGDSGPALDMLLAISDSTMTYRSRYLSAPQFAPVLDLLLAEESNPRSLGFQATALAAHVDHLAARRNPGFYGAEQRLTIWLTGALRTADITVLARRDEDGDRRPLATFLEVLRSKLWELSETLTREYFTHALSRSSAASASLLREALP